MALPEAIRKRVDELLGSVDEIGRLGNNFDQVTKPQDLARCSTWIAAAQNIVHQICEGTGRHI
jgi:hypothetical protein